MSHEHDAAPMHISDEPEAKKPKEKEHGHGHSHDHAHGEAEAKICALVRRSLSNLPP